jgi:hypothetical protein
LTAALGVEADTYIDAPPERVRAAKFDARSGRVTCVLGRLCG